MKKMISISLTLFATLNLANLALADESQKTLLHAKDPYVEETKKWAKTGTAAILESHEGIHSFPFGIKEPTVTCSPIYVCDIELEKGERVQNVVVGDQVRWIIAPAISGEGSNETPHIMVKPTEENLKTNLIITTNIRSYHINLQSKASQRISKIKFYYPHDLVVSWDQQAKKKDLSNQNVVANLPSIAIDKLNFEYEVEGDPKIKPVRIFDDGTHVYIQMDKEMRNAEAPALFLLNEQDERQLVNYRLKGDYFITDRLFKEAELILGVGDSQSKTIIRRNDPKCYFLFCRS